MFLYANGCSLATGCEAVAEEHINYEKSFPNMIADTLGWEHLNAALPGGSNQRIVRTTIYFVEKWLEENKSPDDLFVLISWTGTDRLEISHGNDRYHLLVHDLDTEIYNNIPRLVRRHYESYLAAVDNRESINLQNVLLMQSFLKNNNINYLFLNGIDEWTKKFLEHDQIIYNALDKQHYLDGGRDRGFMRQWLRNQGFPYAPEGHFREDAYAAYASMIVDYLRESGLIAS